MKNRLAEDTSKFTDADATNTVTHKLFKKGERLYREGSYTLWRDNQNDYYVAYAAETHTRTERATQARPAIREAFTDAKQQEFIEFILEKYVEDGVKELAKSKMNSMVKLKYDNAHDAVAVLGSPGVIKETFAGFQKYLYLPELNV